MIPNFELFGKPLSAYLIIALIGIFVTLFFTYRLAQKKGLDEISVLFIMLLAFAGALIGGHLLYGVTNIRLIADLIQNPAQISSFNDFINSIAVIFGGSVFYGGLLGGLLTAYCYIRKTKLPFSDYSDLCTLAIPLFHIFGRIGCFLSGCCYGIEWSHGIVYRYSVIESANHVPRLPVQLIEATGNLLIFILLLVLYQKNRGKGKLLYTYLLIYPVMRFTLEFFRGDEIRGFFAGLSTSQWISIILFLFAAVKLIRNGKKAKKSEP